MTICYLNDLRRTHCYVQRVESQNQIVQLIRIYPFSCGKTVPLTRISGGISGGNAKGLRRGGEGLVVVSGCIDKT